MSRSKRSSNIYFSISSEDLRRSAAAGGYLPEEAEVWVENCYDTNSYFSDWMWDNYPIEKTCEGVSRPTIKEIAIGFFADIYRLVPLSPKEAEGIIKSDVGIQQCLRSWDEEFERQKEWREIEEEEQRKREREEFSRLLPKAQKLGWLTENLDNTKLQPAKPAKKTAKEKK